MHKKNLSFLFIFLCLFLASCLNANQGSLVSPSSYSSPIAKSNTTSPAQTQPPLPPVISKPSLTQTPGLLEQTNIALSTEWAGRNKTIEAKAKRLTFTPSSPSPTQFVDTYPHKQIWFSYTHSSGAHYIYEMYLSGYINFPTLVLYSDGQIILFHDKQPIRTKMLSPDEICSLFITLESMGLSKIQTNGTGDLDDPIYQSPTKLTDVSDDGATELYINGITPRRYVVTDHNKDYAVKAILNIFAFLNLYEPRDLLPYHADRLYVFVSPGQEVFLQMYGETQAMKPLPWPGDATPLSQNDQGTMYLEGEAASKVFDLIGSYYGLGGKVFVDQVVEYTVVIKILLPNEWRGKYNNSEYKTSEPFKPSFSCKYVTFK